MSCNEGPRSKCLRSHSRWAGRPAWSGLQQKRIRKLHLSSRKGFHRRACSAFHCLWDWWRKDTFNRYINSCPQRRQSYQIFFHEGEKGFKLAARETEAKPFLTPTEWTGWGRKEHIPRKRGRMGKEEQTYTRASFPLALRTSIDPPSRKKHTPLFLNTEHEAKQSTRVAAGVPPCHAL